MENFKQIILISKDYSNPLTIGDYEIYVIDSAVIIDTNSLKHNNETLYFDYLIIDDLTLVSNLKIRLEHKKALTNYYLETSIERIFAIGKANNSNRDISEELESVLEYIQEG